MAILKSTNIFGTLKIHALTQSTSPTTGSLVVSGGVGIGKDVSIAGKINGLTITPVTSKILDLSVASFKSGYGVNTGSITVTSDSATARTLTLGRDITLTGDAARTLTIKDSNKTLTGAGATLTFGGNFTTSGAHATTLTTSGTTALRLPTTGTLISSEDTGTVTNTMLAGSIANDKLSNSAISGISLGGNLKNLTAGDGLTYNSGTTYNGSGALTIRVDTAATGTPSIYKTLTTGSLTIANALTNGTVNIANGTAALTANTEAVNILSGAQTATSARTRTLNLGSNGSSNITTNINIGTGITGAGGTITLGTASKTYLKINNDISFVNASSMLVEPSASNIAGKNLTISAGSSGIKTTKGTLAGGDLILSSGKNVGNTTSKISFNVASGTADGTALNGLSEIAYINKDGFIPSTSDKYNLGSSTLKWKDAYFSGNTYISGDTHILGDLIVDGETITLNTTTMEVEDNNIELGSIPSPTDLSADGGGITLKSNNTDKTIKWINSTDSWTFNQGINITTGGLKIKGADVINSSGQWTGGIAGDLTGDVGSITGTITNVKAGSTITNVNTGATITNIDTGVILTNHTGSIGTNTGAITTNTGAIGTISNTTIGTISNDVDFITHSGAITTNTGAITTNTGAITNVNTGATISNVNTGATITTVKSGATIGTVNTGATITNINTGVILTNHTGSIGTNTGAITTNTGAITNVNTGATISNVNTGAIITAVKAGATITTNSGGIGTSSGAITTNTGAITTNTGAITNVNTGATISNVNDGATITAVKAGATITTNSGAITTNTGAITTNTGAITNVNTGATISNVNDGATITNVNTGATITNVNTGATITTNSGAITSNSGGIGTSSGAITTNTGAITNVNSGTTISNVNTGSTITNVNSGATIGTVNTGATITNISTGAIFTNHTGTIGTNSGAITTNTGTITNVNSGATITAVNSGATITAVKSGATISKIETGVTVNTIANATTVTNCTNLTNFPTASITFAGAGTIKSTGASALTLDSGTTGEVNIGTGASAKTITIGSTSSSAIKLANLNTNGFVKTSGTNGTLSVDTNSYLNLTGGTLTGTLTSRAITPSANNTYDIGTSSVKYKDGYFAGTVNATTFNGDLSGTATYVGANGLNTNQSSVTPTFTRVQASGLSSSWGSQSGTSTGAFNAIMGTGIAATWLWSGTSGTTVKAGFQMLDTGNSGRLYVGDSYLELTDSGSGTTGMSISAGYITESSDRRLKTEINNISGALDKVKNLTGCTFKKVNSDKVSMGLIAQDTQKVIPEVVNEGSDGYLGIQYSNIVALLIEAIKEQQEQIDYLKSKVDKKKWWKIF